MPKEKRMNIFHTAVNKFYKKSYDVVTVRGLSAGSGIHYVTSRSGCKTVLGYYIINKGGLFSE